MYADIVFYQFHSIRTVIFACRFVLRTKSSVTTQNCGLLLIYDSYAILRSSQTENFNQHHGLSALAVLSLWRAASLRMLDNSSKANVRIGILFPRWTNLSFCGSCVVCTIVNIVGGKLVLQSNLSFHTIRLWNSHYCPCTVSNECHSPALYAFPNYSTSIHNIGWWSTATPCGSLLQSRLYWSTTTICGLWSAIPRKGCAWALRLANPSN